VVPIDADDDSGSPFVVVVSEDPLGQPEEALQSKEEQRQAAEVELPAWVLKLRDERHARARHVLAECIAALRDSYRVVAALLYGEPADRGGSPTVEQVGKMLGITENTVRIRRLRAQRDLADCLAANGASYLEL
jgi:hypothetical protein